MKSEIVLVLGGARSGKSSFAEKYVLRKGAICAYIATAEILDEEMAHRVKHHRERRDHRWVNIEAPYEAEKFFPEASDSSDSILFDCLTLYTSNLLYRPGALEGTFDERLAHVMESIDKLLAAARKTNKCVVFVSNDVGSSLVPDNPMGREFRDIVGWVNQKVGNEADKVFYAVAGQVVDIKKLAFKIDEEV